MANREHGCATGLKQNNLVGMLSDKPQVKP
jgi:hypothetical protein